jgi:large subunit ribosomal protein L29
VSTQSDSLKALRDMNDDELLEHLRLTRRKLFEIRFQQATGQVENHRQIRDLRHEIARTMTVQIEAQRQPAFEGPTGPAGLGAPPGRAPRKSPRPGPSLARHPSASESSVAEGAKPAVPSVARHPSTPESSVAEGAKSAVPSVARHPLAAEAQEPVSESAAELPAPPARRVRRTRAAALPVDDESVENGDE